MALNAPQGGFLVPLEGVEQLPESELLSAREQLSERERAQMDRLTFAADRWRYLQTHAATRALLGEYLGVAPESVEIAVER